MAQEQPSPPSGLKPWYYQDWFLFPVFIFWPVWAVLILRSPWHNGLVSGAVAWAMLIAGSFLVVTRLQLGGTVLQSTLMFIIPGLILTVVTQALWFQDRQRLRQKGPAVDSDAPLTTFPKSRRPRNRRRSKGQRNSPAGRSSRGR
ncbi:MAG TPA: hypothetical protein VFA32_02245 [Dehalococcoidia bacterium]|jgi:hypothetical protein|nr:hypothetical protein [Dehalococcoidia bacterium]